MNDGHSDEAPPPVPHGGSALSSTSVVVQFLNVLAVARYWLALRHPVACSEAIRAFFGCASGLRHQTVMIWTVG